MPPSSRGLGYRPFKAATGIRIPLGAPISAVRTFEGIGGSQDEKVDRSCRRPSGRTLAFSGCKNLTGDELELRDRLSGHWKNEDAGDTYFSKDKMTVTAGGKTYTVGYRVVHGDASRGQVVLRVDKKISDENLEMISSQGEVSIAFSEDGKSIQVSGLLFKKTPEAVTFKRADDKQSP